jgi:hypothetical protein
MAKILKMISGTGGWHLSYALSGIDRHLAVCTPDIGAYAAWATLTWPQYDGDLASGNAIDWDLYAVVNPSGDPSQLGFPGYGFESAGKPKIWDVNCGDINGSALGAKGHMTFNEDACYYDGVTAFTPNYPIVNGSGQYLDYTTNNFPEKSSGQFCVNHDFRYLYNGNLWNNYHLYLTWQDTVTATANGGTYETTFDGTVLLNFYPGYMQSGAAQLSHYSTGGDPTDPDVEIFVQSGKYNIIAGNAYGEAYFSLFDAPFTYDSNGHITGTYTLSDGLDSCIVQFNGGGSGRIVDNTVATVYVQNMSQDIIYVNPNGGASWVTLSGHGTPWDTWSGVGNGYVPKLYGSYIAGTNDNATLSDIVTPDSDPTDPDLGDLIYNMNSVGSPNIQVRMPCNLLYTARNVNVHFYNTLIADIYYTQDFIENEITYTDRNPPGPNLHHGCFTGNGGYLFCLDVATGGFIHVMFGPNPYSSPPNKTMWWFYLHDEYGSIFYNTTDLNIQFDSSGRFVTGINYPIVGINYINFTY